MVNLHGVEGNLKWIYILIRRIDGSILANILNLDSLGSHPLPLGRITPLPEGEIEGPHWWSIGRFADYTAKWLLLEAFKRFNDLLRGEFATLI